MSDLTLIIGNKNYSSWSLRAWVFLKHNNIPFQEKQILLSTESTDAELAEYQSGYKVPVLLDGDLIVWDSLSILEYVAEKYLDYSGWPADIKARSFARSVSCEMHSSFMNVRNELPMNCRKKFSSFTITHDAELEIERIKSLWRRCRELYGADGQWLFGKYSIADAMFAPIALRFDGYNISLDGVEGDYLRSVLNQPAIMEWVEAGKAETEVIEEDEINL